MKNVYLGVGAVIIATASFFAGMHFDQFRGAANTVEGTVVSRDSSSITVRMEDNSVRSVPLSDASLVVGQPEPVLTDVQSIAVGQRVTITLSGNAAQSVAIHLPQVPPAQ